MMNRDERVKKDFENYKFFLKDYFPKFNVSDNQLMSFYLYVNNTFVLCDILIEFEKIDKDCNHYNLLIEYREFYARLLTTIAINDKFLVENIFRMVIEKLYRIIYGMIRSGRFEKKIRKISRSEMKLVLNDNISSDNFTEINKLYGDYSTKVHHTVSIPEDYFNLTKRLESKQNYLEEFLNSMMRIEKIFLEEVFLKKSPNSFTEETAYKKKIRNNTSDDIISKLNLLL